MTFLRREKLPFSLNNTTSYFTKLRGKPIFPCERIKTLQDTSQLALSTLNTNQTPISCGLLVPVDGIMHYSVLFSV